MHSKFNFKNIRTLNVSPKIFLVFVGKLLSKCPSFAKPSLSWKIFVCPTALRHYSFLKTPRHKCLTVFWIRLCLDNCSVICTVTLRKVLHPIHSEFQHIQKSVFFRHMQTYSALLRVFTYIEASLRHIEAYSAIFSVIPV